jgi:8-oxo-dGTP pyrophosphatase MutT (NUDIX family)
MTQRSAARAIVLHGDRLLAMQRHKFGHEYYTLIGGGIESGEDSEAALRRELREETGMEVGAVRLVFTEDGGSRFGRQHIFLCEYLGGDPVLAVDSEEAISSALGQNTYRPLWLPLADVPHLTFRSSSVRDALLAGIQDGWPESPVELAWKGEDVGK